MSTPGSSSKQNLQDTFHTVAILFEILHKYHLTESCITFKVWHCNIYERMSNRSTQLTLLNVANLVGGRRWGGARSLFTQDTVFPQAGSVLNQLPLHLSNEFSHSQHKIRLLSEWQATHHHHAHITHCHIRHTNRKLRTVNNTDAWSWSSYLIPWSSPSWQEIPRIRRFITVKEPTPSSPTEFVPYFSASILDRATQNGGTMNNVAVPRKCSAP